MRVEARVVAAEFPEGADLALDAGRRSSEGADLVGGAGVVVEGEETPSAVVHAEPQGVAIHAPESRSAALGVPSLQKQFPALKRSSVNIFRGKRKVEKWRWTQRGRKMGVSSNELCRVT